ncbi:aminotransferase class IV [Psychrobacter faecalis]|jgi:4-amino-4-deoxychorismate lyase|uniref:aminotransferase class IV n=1 Tax=Psychrobacter faecalis TaxID=180588 RepID=UPI0019189EA2|nr:MULTISPECIES: aminotransferase class IV [Psychrobacter]MCG3860253.1 aminotransferase class IV [Psychrobacter sp. Ps5]
MSPNSWICLHPSGATEAKLSLDNRGLAYGDGFFTTMGVIDGQILWLDYHQQRLVSHATALQLQLDSQSLLAMLKTHAKQLQQGMLKLIVTRAEQEVRGYGYTPNIGGSACEIWLKSTPMAITTAQSLPLANNQFIPLQPAASAICLSSQIACLPPPLSGLKSLNRLDNVLASGELNAIKAQAIEAKTWQDNIKPSIAEGLLRDMSGLWVEGTMSNVFYQLVEASVAKSSNRPHSQNNSSSNYLSTGQWYTPSMAQSGVAGVMRQVIIDTLSTRNNPVIIRSLQDDDLPHLSQLFFCNALRGIMPMTSLRLFSGEVVSFEAI